MKKTAVLMFLLISLCAVSLFAGVGKYFIEVKATGPAEMGRIRSLGLDVAGVNRAESLVGIIADEEDIMLLGREGFAVSIREEYGRAEDDTIDPYYTPAEMLAEIQRIEAEHPDLVDVFVASEELWEGHYIYGVRITKNVGVPNDRPTFFMDAQHHARELMTSQIAVDMIEHLASNYGTDPRVTEWLDNINVLVIPMVNPDGVDYVFTDYRWQRKNRNPECGVDLNRNYNFNWDGCDGSSGWCGDDLYRGPSPTSEPETRAMEKLMAENPAIWALTYHSYGEYILYPFGCYDPSENQAFWEFASELNSILENDEGQTGMYETGPGWSSIYITDGTSDDAHYGRYGAYSYCIEVNSTGFQPSYTEYRDKTVERQRTAWMFFLDKTLDSPRVQGFVRDALTGEPLKAQTEISEIPMVHNEVPRQAGANGFYARPLPANGIYNITFSHPGYCSETRQVSIGEHKQLLDVELTPSGANPASNPSPANNAVNQGLSVDLSWTGTSGSYSLYFGESNNPPLVASLSGTSHSVSNLEYGKTYYWRVDTSGSCGNSVGQLWSFSTFKYGITSVAALSNPIRLPVTGVNFSYDSTIKVNGVAVPKLSYKGSSKLVGKGGAELKAMLPKGVPVTVTIEDPQGGTSAPFTFTR